MNVAAGVMVMSGGRGVHVRDRSGIRNLPGSHMDVRVVVLSVRLVQPDGRPVSRVPDGMPGLRHAMQVHGRQDGDAQTDAEVAEGIRQGEAPTAV